MIFISPNATFFSMYIQGSVRGCSLSSIGFFYSHRSSDARKTKLSAYDSILTCAQLDQIHYFIFRLLLISTAYNIFIPTSGRHVFRYLHRDGVHLSTQSARVSSYLLPTFCLVYIYSLILPFLFFYIYFWLKIIYIFKIACITVDW